MVKILVTILLTSSVWIVSGQDAQSVINEMTQRVTSGAKYAEVHVQMKREDFEREMGFQIWTKGQDLALIRLTAPEREKGVAFLKNESGLWNWQPRIQRSIKMPASMMMQSWMGTDMTFDDILGASGWMEKYDANIIGSERIENVECHKIQLIPKDDSDVLWGKIITWIAKRDYIQWRAEYYEEDGSLVHTMQASKLKNFGGYQIPQEVLITPADGEGETRITYLDVDLSPKVEDGFFTKNNLTSLPQ